MGTEVGVPARPEPVAPAERAALLHPRTPPARVGRRHPAPCGWSYTRPDTDIIRAAEGHELPHSLWPRAPDVPAPLPRLAGTAALRGALVREAASPSGKEQPHGDLRRPRPRAAEHPRAAGVRPHAWLPSTGLLCRRGDGRVDALPAVRGKERSWGGRQRKGKQGTRLPSDDTAAWHTAGVPAEDGDSSRGAGLRQRAVRVALPP